MAAALIDDLGAAMGAAVEQDVNGSVAVTGQHHRLAPELGGEIVAGIGNLARVADEQPGAPENPLHLQLEHVGVRIDAPVDAARLDEIGNRFRISVQHGMLILGAALDSESGRGLSPRRRQRQDRSGSG